MDAFESKVDRGECMGHQADNCLSHCIVVVSGCFNKMLIVAWDFKDSIILCEIKETFKIAKSIERAVVLSRNLFRLLAMGLSGANCLAVAA